MVAGGTPVMRLAPAADMGAMRADPAPEPEPAAPEGQRVHMLVGAAVDVNNANLDVKRAPAAALQPKRGLGHAHRRWSERRMELKVHAANQGSVLPGLRIHVHIPVVQRAAISRLNSGGSVAHNDLNL